MWGEKLQVLVTGGAGYVGSHVVRLLAGTGHDVVVLDDLGSGHREAVGDVPLVVGSIDDAELVRRVVREHGVDEVVHLAGRDRAAESMQEPGRSFADNVARTNVLLDTLRQAGVLRAVLASTCAVYGSATHLPVDEQHPLAPENPYGESKRMVEQMLSWYGTGHDLRWVSLRCFNAAGAASDGTIGEDRADAATLIPSVMRTVLGRSPAVTVFGTDHPTPDGTGIRDYVHVEDVADAYVRALAYLRNGGESTAVNLATGTGTSVREVIDAAMRVTGVDVPTIAAGPRAGDPVAIYGDNGRARELLGWRPQRDFEEVIASAWRWHAAHPDGFAGG